MEKLNEFFSSENRLMKLNKFLLLAAVAKAQDAPAASSPELTKLIQGMTPEKIQALIASK